MSIIVDKKTHKDGKEHPTIVIVIINGIKKILHIK